MRPTAARSNSRRLEHAASGSPARSERLPLVVFLAAVFAVKLAVMLQLESHILTQPDAGLDTTAYVTLARRVLGGDILLGPGLYFVSPLYIYVIAAVLGVARSFAAVRLLQIALGTCAVALVYVSADVWFGRRSAWCAAALAALTGVFTFYESLLLQTALDPFLTAAALASLAIALRRGDPRWAACAGLAFSLHAYNRPNVALPAAAVALLLVLARRRRLGLAFTAGLAIALAPITLRNIVSSGYWSPVTTSHGGLNFYIGNNADADGTYRPVAGITPTVEGQLEDARRIAEQATGHPVDDAAISSYYYTLALTWMRGHPASALLLLGRKIALTFSAASAWLNYSYLFFARDAETLLRLLVAGPWMLIPLGLVGLVAGARSKGIDFAIWASFVPAYALSVAAFYVTDRYQLPLLVPLCVTAGAALDWFVANVSSGRWRSVAIATAAFVTLFAWVNRPLPLDDGIAEERTRMAERLVTLGRYQEAEQWTERAARAHPRPGVVHFRIAQRLLARDQSAAAIDHFETALRLDPSQPAAEYALGEAYLDAERAREAVPHLRRAFEAGVRVDRTGYDLARALGATGDRADAIRVLHSVHPLRADDVELWLSFGELAIQLDDAVLAETFARKAIEARRDSSPAHGQLGVVLNLEHRWTDATRELEEAIRLNPHDAAPHVGLAVAAANSGRLADARLHVQEALRLDPDSALAKRLRDAIK